jgi:hypothetical protein
VHLEIENEERRPMKKRHLLILCAAAGLTTACAPTVKVQFDEQPLNIYAKLDVNVRVRLDQEVQALIKNNPEIF